MLSDLATQCVGAIGYGLYPTSSRDAAKYEPRGGGAAVLIAEDQGHVDQVQPPQDRLPELKQIVVIDDSNMFHYEHPS